MAECYLVTNLPFLATTVFYDVWDTVGREILGEKELNVDSQKFQVILPLTNLMKIIG